MRIMSLGHAVFAAMMMAAGIMGLIRGDFVGVWGGVPEHLPGRETLVYVCAAVALACGVGLVLKPTTAFAARLLLIFLLLWLIAFKVQFIVRAPMVEGSYQTNGETAVIVAGAWVVYTWLAGDWDRRTLGFAAGEMGLRIARVLYAFGMLAF